MPICKASGCNCTALYDNDYCSLHLHKNVDDDDPIGKVCTAVCGASAHAFFDTKTVNNGFELTEQLMDSCDTAIGKGVVMTAGIVASEAAGLVVQGVKHIGTTVKLLNLFGAFD